MRLERVTDSSHPMYNEALRLYQISFPYHEQREELSQKRILGDSEYCFDLVYDEDRFVGLILYWENEEFIYIEHFCICPEMRNKRYGERVLALLGKGEKPRILDMCTGSGCILLSLLAMKEGASGTGADISPLALKVAKQNAKGLNVADRAEFVESDLFLSPFFAETTGKALPVYDILISNPPYIRSAVIEDLMEEVKGHDPRIALDGHEDGLYFYRRIVSEGSAYVKENGWMLFEIGYDQGEDVSKLLEKAGFRQVQVIQDLAGLDRVVIGQKPHR